MIKIRYRGPDELSPGLHATAERRGRRTTVYLLDGMTAEERRSALRRLRLTARMGRCPRLPAGQLAFALLIDRLRTGFGRTGAVLRLHPAGSTVPIMVLSGGAIAFLLFSTVSIHVLRPPRTANQSAAGTSPVISASAIATGGGPQHQAAGRSGGYPGDRHGPADPGGTSGGSQAWQVFQPSRGSTTTSPPLAAGGVSAATASGSDGSVSGRNARNGGGRVGTGGTSGGTTLSGGADPTQASPPPATPATTTPAPAATDPSTPSSSSGSSGSSSSSSSSSSSGGVCVDVGSLGVCLDV